MVQNQLSEYRPINFLHYYFGAFAGGFVQFAALLGMGWYAPTSIRLKEEYDDISSSQINHLPQISSFGNLIGILCVGMIASRYGRKIAMFTVNLPNVAALILLLTVNNNVSALYANRLLAGYSIGGIFSVVPAYVCEISTPSIRGVLISTSYILGQMGILFEYCVVPIVTIKMNLVICLGLTIGSCILILLVPESPYWLLKSGRYSQAERSLKYFRRNKDVAEDIKRMTEAIEEEKKFTGGYWDLVKNSTNFKALLIVFFVFLMQGATGGSTMMQYSQKIFKQSNTSLSVEASGVIFCLSNIVFGFIFSPLIDIFGRKPLLIASTFLIGFPLVVLGLFFHLKDSDVSDNFFVKISCIPLVCLIAYNIFHSSGLMTIPYSYQTEMFPTNVRSQASVVISFYGALVNFLVVSAFTFFTDNFEFSVIFFIIGGICFVLSFLAVFILPETKGLSLEEIQKLLNN